MIDRGADVNAPSPNGKAKGALSGGSPLSLAAALRRRTHGSGPGGAFRARRLSPRPPRARHRAIARPVCAGWALNPNRIRRARSYFSSFGRKLFAGYVYPCLLCQLASVLQV